MLRQENQSRFDQLSINEIAEIVRKKHHLRAHGKVGRDGLIEYPNKPINYTKLERPIHGFQNTCRAAALIPHLLDLYLNNIRAFQSNAKVFHELQRLNQLQIENADAFAREVKLMQVAALMRSSGRCHGMKDQRGKVIGNPDHSNGFNFREQSAVECRALMTELGISENDANRVVPAIIECEDRAKGPQERQEQGLEGLSLQGCLLADAVMIENVRTRKTPTPDNKDTLIHVRDFALCKNATADQGSDLRNAFEQLVCRHVALMQQQQGFILHGLYDDEDNIIAGYPKLNSAKDKKNPENAAHQGRLEHTNTFSQYEEAVRFAQESNLVQANAVSVEPAYLKDLRGQIKAASKDKVAALKELYHSLRHAMGTDKTVADVLTPWQEKYAAVLSKHTHGLYDSIFGKKDQPTATQQFLATFADNHNATSLYVSARDAAALRVSQ